MKRSHVMHILELSFLQISPLLLFSFNSILNVLTRMWLWSSTTALDHNILGVYRHHYCKKNLKVFVKIKNSINNSVCKRAACKTVRIWDLWFNLNRELRHEKTCPICRSSAHARELFLIWPRGKWGMLFKTRSECRIAVFEIFGKTEGRSV